MKWLVLSNIAFLLTSCVKDASDISPNTFFDVKVNGVGIAQAAIVADNTLKYRVALKTLDGVEIDDGKNVTVSVSEGSVSVVSNLSASTASTQISVPIEGGKGEFYYVPGRKAQKLAILSITLQGLSQVFNFDVVPLEPTQIQLAVNPSQPKIANDVEMMAFLINSNPSGAPVSDNLKVYFDVTKATSLDSIEAYVSPPTYGNTSLSTQTGFVTTKINLATNKKPGRIVIKAIYTKLDGTTVQGIKTVIFTR